MAVTGKMFSVYMVTSVVSGKRYIGITSRTVAQRWKAHCRDAKNGAGFHLHAAIRKYGEDQFLIQVLSAAQSLEEACQLERAAIAKYETFGDGGYNLTIGGEGATGHVKSIETRALHSAAAKNQWADESSRKRMVDSLKSAWSDPEARARLRTALKAAGARPEVKAKRSAAMTKRMADTKEQVRMAAKERANRPDLVERQRERMTQHWQDQEVVARHAGFMQRMWADPEKKEQIRESLKKAWVARKARSAASAGGAAT